MHKYFEFKTNISKINLAMTIENVQSLSWRMQNI